MYGKRSGPNLLASSKIKREFFFNALFHPVVGLHGTPVMENPPFAPIKNREPMKRTVQVFNFNNKRKVSIRT